MCVRRATIKVKQTLTKLCTLSIVPRDFVPKMPFSFVKMQISSKNFVKNLGFCHFCHSQYAIFLPDFHVMKFWVRCEEYTWIGLQARPQPCGETSRPKNDCIRRAFSAAGIPVKKEPAGLVRSDGKNIDSCTIIPWRRDKLLAWDIRVCATTAASYVTAASHTAVAASEQAADRKCAINTELSAAYEFQPVAVESHEPPSEATASFLVNLGSIISERSGEPLETISLPASQHVDPTLQLNRIP